MSYILPILFGVVAVISWICGSPLLAYAILGLLFMQASSVIIQLVFNAVRRAETDDGQGEAKENNPSLWAELKDEFPKAFFPTGGTVIGWLERWAIFLTVAFFAEPWMIVGAIITFKSFGRYPEILAERNRPVTNQKKPDRSGSPEQTEETSDNQQTTLQNTKGSANKQATSVKFVEKFLIGTAISVLIAVGAGMIMRLIILPHYGVNLLDFGAVLTPQSGQSVM